MRMNRVAWMTLVLGASMVACGQTAGGPIEEVDPGNGGEEPQVQSDARVSDFPPDPYACMYKPGLNVPDLANISVKDLMVCMGAFGHSCWLTGPLDLTGLPYVGGFYNAGTGEYNLAGHGLCQHACQGDADCPAPATGTAIPYCFRWSKDEGQGLPGECRLACKNAEVCPDGFHCFDPGVTLTETGETIGKSCYAYDVVSSDDD